MGGCETFVGVAIHRHVSLQVSTTPNGFTRRLVIFLPTNSKLIFSEGGFVRMNHGGPAAGVHANGGSGVLRHGPTASLPVRSTTRRTSMSQRHFFCLGRSPAGCVRCSGSQSVCGLHPDGSVRLRPCSIDLCREIDPNRKSCGGKCNERLSDLSCAQQRDRKSTCSPQRCWRDTLRCRSACKSGEHYADAWWILGRQLFDRRSRGDGVGFPGREAAACRLLHRHRKNVQASQRFLGGPQGDGAFETWGPPDVRRSGGAGV